MKPLFNCSQADFILVVNTGLNSFLEHQPLFPPRSPKFTLAWETTMRTDIDAAEAMPTEAERDAESQLLADDLDNKADLGRNYYQRLKGHITNSFPANLVDIKLKAAGQGLYEKANNWPSLMTMLGMAQRFIAANLAALLANDEMPPTFPTEFDTVIADFRASLATYQDFREVIMVESQDRIAALNSVHKRFMPMMKIGQDIFKDNPAVYTQFVFADVLARVGGHGQAGFDGKVIDSVTNLPIPGALIKLFLPDNPETEYTTMTNGDGDYIVNCPSGTYTVTVGKPGYNSHTMEGMVVEVGTVSRLNVKLSPMVEGV